MGLEKEMKIAQLHTTMKIQISGKVQNIREGERQTFRRL